MPMIGVGLVRTGSERGVEIAASAGPDRTIEMAVTIVRGLSHLVDAAIAKSELRDVER